MWRTLSCFKSTYLYKPVVKPYLAKEYIKRNILEKYFYSVEPKKCLSLDAKYNGPYIISVSSVNLLKPRNYVTSCCNFRYFSLSHRNFKNNSKYGETLRMKRRSTLYYIMAVGVLAVGSSYAAVPLYRIFCQAYSYGGTVKQQAATEKIESLAKREDRKITVRFNADTAAAMTWNFKPQQNFIKVIPGETALAFYSARNPTDKPVVGISTYNVIPFEAGQYFNKIQCFCFEEQMLNPKEHVSMPVFFYIDPEFADDPKMEYVNEILLSYTFFEAKDGIKLPLPGFHTN